VPHLTQIVTPRCDRPSAHPRLREQRFMLHRSQKAALTLVSRSRAQRGPSRAQENSFASCGAIMPGSQCMQPFRHIERLANFK